MTDNFSKMKSLQIEGMIMIIQHNMIAMNASRQFGISIKEKAKRTERLSSVYYCYASSESLLINLAAIATSFGVLFSGLSVLRLFEMNEKISKKSHKVLGIVIVSVALFMMIPVLANGILRLFHLI